MTDDGRKAKRSLRGGAIPWRGDTAKSVGIASGASVEYTDSMREARHGDMPEVIVEGLDELYGNVVLNKYEQISWEATCCFIDEIIEEAEPDIPEIVLVRTEDAKKYCQLLIDCELMRTMPESRDLAELEVVFRGLRRLLSERLALKHPDHKIIWWLGHLDRQYPRIFAAEGNRVVKLPPDFQGREAVESPITKLHRHRALRVLYSTDLRSQHLAYHILSYDATYAPRRGIQVQRRLPLVTLDRVLASEQRPSLGTALRYLHEGLEGLQFLLDHELRLADLSDKNLGINTETDTALWFDFDGLRCEGAEVNGFVGQDDYIPPERGADGNKNMPITEAEMVYECGVMLRRVLATYPEHSSSLDELQDEMVRARPLHRPVVVQVQEWLERECARMEAGLRSGRSAHRR